MKKSNIIKAIIFAGLICTTLAACTDNKPIQNNTIEDRPPLVSTITAQPEKSHYIFVERTSDSPDTIKSGDKQTVYVSLSVETASFVAENRADRPAAKLINETLAAANKKASNIFNDLSDRLETHLADKNADTSVFPWEVKIDYSCKRNDGKAISVWETIDTYTAGAPMGTTEFSYNFDPITGNRIGQVFYIPDDEESFDKADDVLYKKLLSKYGEETINYENV